VVMAFASKELTTALVTTHLPLAEVPEAVTADSVARSTYWLVDLLRRLGKRRPRVVVAALNPHAGARGRLERAGRAAELFGPMGAESAFRLSAKGEFDGVVAMYHDQATIPSKLL